jgi:predicted XRE-type DNA-binding protein
LKSIDTKIRHVTKPGANLFKELGFEDELAQQYHEQSKRQINDMRVLKEQLMSELATWIEQNNLKQEQAAKILCITRPRVSDMVNLKFSKFTIDALVEMLARIGKPVRLVVG